MAVSETPSPVLRQSAIVLALSWLLAPLQFGTAIVVVRVLGPEGKGALALLTGLTAILVGLIGLGIPSGTAVLYRQADYSRREVIGTALALTFVSSAVLFAAYAWAGTAVLGGVLSGRDLRNVEPHWILLALVAVTPAALSAVADVVLIAADAMRTYAVRAAATGLLLVAFTWTFTIHLGWGVAGALASYPLAAIAGLVMFVHWWWTDALLRGGRATVDCARALLRIGVQQHAVGIIALVAKRVDVFLIASMLTLEDAGYYAAAILIPQAVVSIPRASMWPLVSALSMAPSDVPRVAEQAARLQVLLMGVISILLWLLAPVIITALFGRAFEPSIAPLRWALPGLLFTPLTITVNAILTARARPGISIVSALLGTGLQLALTILLVPRWGTSGAAAALSANFITTALVQLVAVRSQGVRVGAMLLPTAADLAHLWRILRARRPV